MNEPDDKPLHDWVRQSLHTYRPAVNPQDWQRMQRALRRRRWWRNGIVGGVCLLVLLLTGWLWMATEAPEAVKRPSLSTRSRPVDKRMVPKLVPAIEQKRPLPTSSQRARQVIQPVRTIHRMQEKQMQQQPVALLQSRNVLTPLSTTSYHVPSTLAFSTEELAIRHQLKTGDFGSDSTSYRVLDRSLRQWPNAVIVCDLTTSMYPYSTQLFAWFKKHTGKPGVKGFVFFTDCDSLGNQTQPNGPPGQMFVTRDYDVNRVLPIMIHAARNTVRNEDDAENDVEALLFAQKTFPDAQHLILIADNISSVKDMNRLGNLRKPVHIVLCGTTGSTIDQPFQSSFYTIASRTSGSLHTLEDDLNPAGVSSSTVLHVGPHYYRYKARKKLFKLTPFTHRPTRILGLFWL